MGGVVLSNRFFITLLVVIGLAIGGFAITKQKTSNSNTTKTNTAPTNHIKGSPSSGVVLIEYGDFQCPACKQYHPIFKQLAENYKDRVTFQFRNFPLVQIHKNAFLASRAAEAADKQGKFWEMHDLLYENQQSWESVSNPTSIFTSIASQLGLDTELFNKDMISQETNDKINADISEGKKSGANSTPTFVLNGKKLGQNPRSLEEFSKLLDEAIAAKKQ